MAEHRKRLRRYENKGDVRFLTFSCYQRLPLFNTPSLRDAFAKHLATVRGRGAFRLLAWVIMPQHVHLLLLPAHPDWPVSRILVAIKQPFAQRYLRPPVSQHLIDRSGQARFWQRGGGYDRNQYSYAELREKLDYIHLNPVRRKLVRLPSEWTWSSARWYEGDQTGFVTIDTAIIV